MYPVLMSNIRVVMCWNMIIKWFPASKIRISLFNKNL